MGQVIIKISDSLGGEIAQGTSQIENFDILEPVTFPRITVLRK